MCEGAGSGNGIESYRDLLVWQRGMFITEQVYRLARSFPRDELFGLTSQTRRAAVSVPANIAEGYGRGTRQSYAAFLRIARGSLKELETHLLIAERVGLADQNHTAPILTEADHTGRMLGQLIRSLAAPRV